MKGLKLILECYHPASKNSEPYLFCDYLSTPGLSSNREDEGTAYGDNSNVGYLGKLGGLYSRFRPTRSEAGQRAFHLHPAGNVPGHSGTSTRFPDQQHSVNDGPKSLVSHSVNLDSYELWSQLCVVTNLVQLGPRKGVFYGFVNIADSVVRIWRDWLAQRATIDARGAENAHAFRNDAEQPIEQTKLSAGTDAEARTLWIDNRKNVGIQMRIKQRGWTRDTPVILHRDEDPAVSYTMEYEGSPAILRRKPAGNGI